ncbi:hypothetical protein D1872_241320 [compost metagenome]
MSSCLPAFPNGHGSRKCMPIRADTSPFCSRFRDMDICLFRAERHPTNSNHPDFRVSLKTSSTGNYGHCLQNAHISCESLPLSAAFFQQKLSVPSRPGSSSPRSTDPGCHRAPLPLYGQTADAQNHDRSRRIPPPPDQ